MCRLPESKKSKGVAGLVLAALFVAQPLGATESAAEPRAPYPLEVFQQREALLFQIGYRLAASNAPFCDRTAPVTGLLLHDAEAYGQPEAVRYLFGLTGDIGVQAVAPGSPAFVAGLRQNDTVTKLDGEEIAARWTPTDPDWERLHAIREAIDADMVAGSVRVGWTRAGGNAWEAEIAPVPACRSRFELIDSSKTAKADGERVILGENFPGFTYAEDELAAAIAHEMAHNLLGHLDLDRKRSTVRVYERDADRLMPWLLANAGYDPAAAVRFMQAWGPKYGGGLLRKRTHDGWDERVEFITAELPKVEAARDADGMVDWRTHFRPMLQQG